jgi:hypothetical protein
MRPLLSDSARRWLTFGGPALALAVVLAVPAPAQQSTDPPPRLTYHGPDRVEWAVPSVFDGDLRDLPPAPQWRPGDPIKEIPRRGDLGHVPPGYRADPRPPGADPLLALQAAAPPPSSRAFSTPILNLPGQGFTGVNPPDTVGDVGPNHFIQVINSGSGARFVVYDKSGTAVSGPTQLDSLGSGACASGLGDGIVLYDALAGRWLLSEFATSGSHLCIYVSQTGDPVSGGWFAYDFTTPSFPDYPKYGVWADAYLVTSNESGPSPVYALERSQMLIGGLASMQRFTAPDLAGFGFQALTPGDLDGPSSPGGSPDYVMRHRDDEAHNPGSSNPTMDFLELWELSVDFAVPANSTFTGPTNIAVSEFDSDLCGFFTFSCVPQPSGPGLDPLREVIMQRLQYRNFGTHESLVGNLVTDVDGLDHAGVRWFELRRVGAGAWTLFQEGTYAPDADNRWMAASAMDGSGDIAVGYSVSSSSVFPSLRYAGRLEGDPLGTLPQGEYTLVDGTTSNVSNRWGDYAAMGLDPVDDCTFWFTSMYDVNANGTWSTRFGSFKFDSCVSAVVFADGFESGDTSAWSAAVP